VKARAERAGAGLGCPCSSPECAGMALDKPALVRVESVRGVKSKMGLCGCCDSEVKAKANVASCCLRGQETWEKSEELNAAFASVFMNKLCPRSSLVPKPGGRLWG